MNEPKRYNEWYGLIYNLDGEDRESWVKQIIEDIRDEGKKTRNKSKLELADFLEDPKRCLVVGFAPGFEYLMQKDDGRNDWDKSFIHPTAQAVLFVWVKDIKCFMIVGACLEWGKSDFPIEVKGATR